MRSDQRVLIGILRGFYGNLLETGSNADWRNWTKLGARRASLTSTFPSCRRQAGHHAETRRMTLRWPRRAHSQKPIQWQLHYARLKTGSSENSQMDIVEACGRAYQVASARCVWLRDATRCVRGVAEWDRDTWSNPECMSNEGWSLSCSIGWPTI